MSILQSDKVTKIEKLAEGIYTMTLSSGYISASAIPGQFVNIKCCEGNNALLRRPISICSVDRNAGSYDIAFQIKGSGTELLAAKKPGETLNVIGPLGKGFDLDIKHSRIAVVGGGIGVFPLLYLLTESRAIVKRTYLGFRTADKVILESEFSRSSTSLEIATDDGSYGAKGFAPELLKRDMCSEHFDMIYACGPGPMLEYVAEIAKAAATRCQVSLEQRMGCGFGACLVCACKTAKADGSWQYSHVCKDGPVFDSNDVIFSGQEV